jgi:transcriptional regulator with XRE-family HTH domain
VNVVKNIGEPLGRNIAKHRKAAGLTQAQLAERVDVQPETISRIESGKSPSLDLLAQISDVLELELHELFRVNDDNDPKVRAIGRVLWYVSRLSTSEIELFLDIGSAVLTRIRRMQAS